MAFDGRVDGSKRASPGGLGHPFDSPGSCARVSRLGAAPWLGLELAGRQLEGGPGSPRPPRSHTAVVWGRWGSTRLRGARKAAGRGLLVHVRGGQGEASR